MKRQNAVLPTPTGDFLRASEVVLAIAVVSALTWVALFFARWRYLPQPFIYSVDGTYMDWFNTAFWAHRPGAYRVWQTVYPPFSFVFIRFTSLSSCYDRILTYADFCDPIGIVLTWASYVFSVILVARSYSRFDRVTMICRTIAIGLGLPLLYAVERGNLIVPCFAAFVLAYGRVVHQTWLRWIGVAVSINFKPYLLLAALPHAAKRRRQWLEGAGIATVLLYVASYAVIGEGTPFELLNNQVHWSSTVATQYWWNLYYSTSYTPLLSVTSSPLPLLQFIDSRIVEIAPVVLKTVILGGVLFSLLSMLVVWMRPWAAPAYRLAALGLGLVFTLSNPGGYVMMFLFFLVFLETDRSPLVAVAVIAAYLASIPAEHIVITFFNRAQDSWLGGRQVHTDFGLSVGQFVRPAMLLVIQYCLSARTLITSLRAPARLFNSIEGAVAAEA